MWVRDGDSLRGAKEVTFQIGFLKIHLGLHICFLKEFEAQYIKS